MKIVKSNTPITINNKLLIIIAIFITVILIALLCYAMNKPEAFSSGSNSELHYYSLSTCPHCHDFDPIWQSFQKKTDRCHKYVVDEDNISKENADKYNVHSFPTLLVINNGEPIEEVIDRTCGAMYEMCKKHKIPCTVVC